MHVYIIWIWVLKFSAQNEFRVDDMMTSLYTIIQSPILRLRSNATNNCTTGQNCSPKNHGIAFEALLSFSFVLFCLTIIWHWSFFFSSAALSVINSLSLSHSLTLYASLHVKFSFIFMRSSVGCFSVVYFSLYFHSTTMRAMNSNGNQHNQRKFVSSNVIISAISFVLDD